MKWTVSIHLYLYGSEENKYQKLGRLEKSLDWFSHNNAFVFKKREEKRKELVF